MLNDDDDDEDDVHVAAADPERLVPGAGPLQEDDPPVLRGLRPQCRGYLKFPAANQVKSLWQCF